MTTRAGAGAWALTSVLSFGCAEDLAPRPMTDLSAGDSGTLEPGQGADAAADPAADSSTEAAQDAAGEGCVKGHYTAMLRPVDMFILLDQSGSMTEDEDRWTPVTEAIAAFVETPGLTRTGVALQYFPLGSDDEFKCQSENYRTPDVPLAELPQNAAPITDSMTAHYFSQDECCDTPEHSGTPTRPAVQGAVAYMRSYLAQHPERVGVILLATDGEPSDVCDDNEVENVAEVIAEAAQGVPPIRTYVIGIGEDEKLEAMAQAGGTGRGPIAVDGTGAQTERELLDALAGIRQEALPCDYPVVDLLDPQSLNVEHSGQTLVNVNAAADCARASTNAWYYDDPAAPQRVVLCPEACAAIGMDLNAVVRIVEGCETVVL